LTNLLPKLKLTPRLVRLAYRFIDVEASAEAAPPDGRIIEYAFAIEKLIVLGAGKTLDVGCTARLNYLPPTLCSLGWEVWGIDLREFKFRHSNFHFVLGDIRKTDFPDNFFDAVYAVSTLEHIGLSGRYGITKKDTGGDARAVEETARILRPGGRLICTVPWGRQARIISPLQRIYDQPGLESLFEHWVKKDERWYGQGDDGCWTALSHQDALKVENPQGDTALALLELTPLK
jgi:SAM-dependent methyltransferase